ncbi:glycosyl hydrolase family 17 protein [Gracilimonas sediminicola]|uniref:Endo-1,3-beta-glucanase btgC n=1 Tax=Gracilimonas sediminicola TaxID=2952158 RepID=A0A9X2L608_9BACT|nr:glycosyl hydrolase family 17 protein [Gracilimonas sediminicola]MCP9292967.1 glycosyl hydrolase family 17 protein [Gracilimonas sediminicola]
MNNFQKIGIGPGLAICYSGYRKGQKPGNTIPTYEQVKEDLTLITKYWKYIRLYDCDDHSKTVLEVIRNEAFDLQVMLGAFIEAETNNFNCPWGGGIYSKPDLEENAERNLKKIDRLIEMGIQYSDIVFALSVGNEACVDWTDHMVPEQKVLYYVKRVKERTNIPVTFCENYVPWLNKLEELATELDFISIHTYPVWEYKSIQAGLDYTKENYYAVAEKYPDKPVVISEAGWTTRSNGQGIDPLQVNEENQKRYFEELTEWTIKEGIPTFFFEAFDEDWKGSDDPSEPEKHWGIFKIDRTPKLALQEM